MTTHTPGGGGGYWLQEQVYGLWRVVGWCATLEAARRELAGAPRARAMAEATRQVLTAETAGGYMDAAYDDAARYLGARPRPPPS